MDYLNDNNNRNIYDNSKHLTVPQIPQPKRVLAQSTIESFLGNDTNVDTNTYSNSIPNNLSSQKLHPSNNQSNGFNNSYSCLNGEYSDPSPAFLGFNSFDQGGSLNEKNINNSLFGGGMAGNIGGSSSADGMMGSNNLARSASLSSASMTPSFNPNNDSMLYNSGFKNSNNASFQINSAPPYQDNEMSQSPFLQQPNSLFRAQSTPLFNTYVNDRGLNNRSGSSQSGPIYNQNQNFNQQQQYNNTRRNSGGMTGNVPQHHQQGHFAQQQQQQMYMNNQRAMQQGPPGNNNRQMYNNAYGGGGDMRGGYSDHQQQQQSGGTVGRGSSSAGLSRGGTPHLDNSSLGPHSRPHSRHQQQIQNGPPYMPGPQALSAKNTVPGLQGQIGLTGPAVNANNWLLNQSNETAVAELVAETCREILMDAANKTLKAVELANTLRARVGTEILAFVREKWGGLLALLERNTAVFMVERIPKNDLVSLVITPSMIMAQQQQQQQQQVVMQDPYTFQTTLSPPSAQFEAIQNATFLNNNSNSGTSNSMPMSVMDSLNQQSEIFQPHMSGEGVNSPLYARATVFASAGQISRGQTPGLEAPPSRGVTPMLETLYDGAGNHPALQQSSIEDSFDQMIARLKYSPETHPAVSAAYDVALSPSATPPLTGAFDSTGDSAAYRQYKENASHAHNPSRCLHIGNVPINLNENQLLAEFEQFGEVETLKVVTQRNRRFAFVTYKTLDQSIVAKQRMSKIQSWKSAISFAHKESYATSGYVSKTPSPGLMTAFMRSPGATPPLIGHYDHMQMNANAIPRDFFYSSAANHSLPHDASPPLAGGQVYQPQPKQVRAQHPQFDIHDELDSTAESYLYGDASASAGGVHDSHQTTLGSSDDYDELMQGRPRLIEEVFPNPQHQQQQQITTYDNILSCAQSVDPAPSVETSEIDSRSIVQATDDNNNNFSSHSITSDSYNAATADSSFIIDEKETSSSSQSSQSVESHELSHPTHSSAQSSMCAESNGYNLNMVELDSARASISSKSDSYSRNASVSDDFYSSSSRKQEKVSFSTTGLGGLSLGASSQLSVAGGNLSGSINDPNHPIFHTEDFEPSGHVTSYTVAQTISRGGGFAPTMTMPLSSNVSLVSGGGGSGNTSLVDQSENQAMMIARIRQQQQTIAGFSSPRSSPALSTVSGSQTTAGELLSNLRQNSEHKLTSFKCLVLRRLCDDTYVPTQAWPVDSVVDAPYCVAVVSQLRQFGGQTTISKLRGFLRNRLQAPDNIKSVPLKALLGAYPSTFVVNGNHVALVNQSGPMSPTEQSNVSMMSNNISRSSSNSSMMNYVSSSNSTQPAMNSNRQSFNNAKAFSRHTSSGVLREHFGGFGDTGSPSGSNYDMGSGSMSGMGANGSGGGGYLFDHGSASGSGSVAGDLGEFNFDVVSGAEYDSVGNAGLDLSDYSTHSHAMGLRGGHAQQQQQQSLGADFSGPMCDLNSSLQGLGLGINLGNNYSSHIGAINSNTNSSINQHSLFSPPGMASGPHTLNATGLSLSRGVSRSSDVSTDLSERDLYHHRF